jgi:hypothetical protein
MGFEVKSEVETVRLVFELRQNSNRVNAALFEGQWIRVGSFQ